MNRNSYQREWYRANREKLIKRKTNWRKNHPDKVKQYSQKYRQKNKLKLIEANKLYHDTHKSQMKEYNKNYVYFKNKYMGKISCIICGNLGYLYYNYIRNKLTNTKTFGGAVVRHDKKINGKLFSSRCCLTRELIKNSGLPDYNSFLLTQKTSEGK